MKRSLTLKKTPLLIDSALRDGVEDFTDRMTGATYVDISGFRQVSLPFNGVVSLFTGAGGMEIGLERVGFETKVCVEIDADCRATLKANRPAWNTLDHMAADAVGDVRKVTGKELLFTSGLKYGDVGLVTGGAPCQPFSNIGKKQGKDDPKNGDLFLEFVRVVRETKPKAFIFENVAGITHSKHGDVMAYMTHQLDGLGYGLSFQIVNAADYGVPQQRKRFIMLGLLGAKPAFPLPTHVKDLAMWDKITSVLDKRPDYSPKSWITVAQAFAGMSEEAWNRPDCLGMNHSEDMVRRMALVKPGKNFKSLPEAMLPNCWKSGKHQGQDTFGRIEADKPAPTMRTAGYNPTKGKYIHPFENRGLNTMEMAAIQAFPETWQFTSAKGRPTLVSVGRQIGNAVPPGLSEALGKALALQLNRLAALKKL